MRDLRDIQSGNRTAALHSNVGEVYNALVDLIGKVKAAGWREETYRRAEDIVTQIEKTATGRDGIKVKPAELAA